MGKVLRFPEAARRIGDDAQLIPWNVSLIHTGIAELNERFNSSKPGSREIRDEIKRLRKEFDAANGRATLLGDDVAFQEAQELARKLNELLPQVDQYELHVANALWVEKTCPFQPSYLDTIRKFYGTGGAFPLDFTRNSEPARQKINAWAEEQTGNRIKDLLPEGSVNSLTRLVLTNAVYFKGEWAKVFDKRATKEDDFLLAGGTKARTPMMHHDKLDSAAYAAFNGDGTFFDTPTAIRPKQQPPLYPDEHGFLMLEMPYKGDDLSMVVIVPRAADGLPAIEKLLTPVNVQAWIAKLQKREVHVFMPKFKMETGYNMNDSLRAMGMSRAFVSSFGGGRHSRPQPRGV